MQIDKNIENSMVLPFADDDAEIDLMAEKLYELEGTTVKALVDLGVTDEVLRGLVKKYETFPDPAAGDDEYAAVVEGIKEVRSIRGEVETKRKAAKADIVKRGKEIDGESNRIKDVLFGIENPMKDAKQAVDDAEALKEASRIGTIKERIHTITVTAISYDESILSLTSRIADIKAVAIDASFDEFYHEAEETKQRSLSLLTQGLKAAEERAAEAHRLEEQRKAQEAEAARLKEEGHARETEQQAADDKRFEEQAAFNSERARLQADRRALEQDKHDARMEQESQAAVESEKKRIEEMLPDKKKLEKLLREIELFAMPTVKTEAAKAVVGSVLGQMGAIRMYLKAQLDKF